MEHTGKFPYIQEASRRVYAGMMDAMDQSVGQVFQALSEAGMLDNTVVVFSSDNGGSPFGVHSSRGFNWPLRGAKGSLWEGGTRAAAFVWSPLLARPRRVSTQLMHITDWLPTLYSVAGGNTAALGALDGMDMWQHLSHGLRSPRVELLYNIDPPMSQAAIRYWKYKLVLDSTGAFNQRYAPPRGSRPYRDLHELLARSTAAKVLRDFYKTSSLQLPTGWRRRATLTCGAWKARNFLVNDSVFLFDIVRDPCEMYNVASFHPKIVEFLRKRIHAYQAHAAPSLSKPVDPAGFPEGHNGTWAPHSLCHPCAHYRSFLLLTPQPTRNTAWRLPAVASQAGPANIKEAKE
ncbi:hypothetical protein V5799_025949 [Amblyomma americanum]|uniref:Sulfatase N-terminal domain-containing protein n=1 Tax=Amblyomma americanum TaxID=6943 RepID=A0AAQ4DJZ5_AMBAM